MKSARFQRRLIGKLNGIHLGMACIIETFNGQYIALSLLPISTKSLCYGSNTEGAHIINTNKEIEDSIKDLMHRFNFKQHTIIQRNNTSLDICLPYRLEIHKFSKEFDIYFINRPLELLIKANTYLRIELTSNYSTNETDPNYQMQTWKNPVKCTECEKYIQDYEYYTYDTFKNRKLNKALYYCCLDCYNKLLPSKCFKVSFYKITHRILSLSLRSTYWQHKTTGHIIYEAPKTKIPLNPDALISLSEIDKDRKVVDVLILKLKGKVVDEFINELDKLKGNPLMDAEELVKLAHKRGINVRLLGKLTYSSKCSYVRKIAVIAILSRAIKKLVLDALNDATITQDPKDIIISYLNHLLILTENVNTKKLWERLTEYVRDHWCVMVYKSALTKLHMPSLIIAICKQLNITFDSFFNFDYRSIASFNKEKLIIIPSVISQPYEASSLELLIKKAQELDNKGKRSQWNLKGGTEREEATNIYNIALCLAIKIYGKQSLKYVDIALAFAQHLQSRHEEYGNPLNSKWNRSARIPPSKNSRAAIHFFEEAIKIYNKYNGYIGLIESLQCIARLNEEVNIKHNK